MCGIVGYIGSGAKDFVINGLKKLEYRGYDSWGIGFLNNRGFKILKKVGKISQVKPENINISAQAAIGHTRWATHGKVNNLNAHPHTDCQAKIMVVHNGIIENYQSIKSRLIRMGHKFNSETDTEVIPHLIEETLKNNKLSEVDAIIQALKELKGNYALCLVIKNKPKIYAVANGCPLTIGINKNGYFISSDMIAFTDLTKEVVFLKDGTIAELTNDIQYYDLKTGKKKKVSAHKISNAENLSELNGFKHYLFKEINEQPEILHQISLIDRKEIETNAALIRNSFGTFFVACGTAYYATLVGVYLFAQNAHLHVNTTLASELEAFKDFITSKTLLFAVSQSGETADVLEAVKVAKNKRVKVFSLLNNPSSTLARLSDVIMVTPAGREIAVLSTKAFTAQVAVLYLLSNAISGNLTKAKKVLKQTALAVEESLSKYNIDKIRTLAKKIKNARNIFTIGRHINYPTALEAALKIKEASYIHAEGFAGGELKHGTIALIEKDVPCIVFVGEDKTKEEIISNAEEIKSRGGYIIGISPKNNKVFDHWFKVADIPQTSPILNIIPIQLLTYFLALERGLDPDKPRNLAKSVTVK